MSWFYADDNSSKGPIPEAAFAALVQAGRVKPTTLVWREGMTDWLPLSQVAPELLATSSVVELPPLADGPSAPAPGEDEVTCAECGRRFARASTVMLAGKPVCAVCKPVFVQRLSEGAPLARLGVTGRATEEEILARDYRIDLGASLNAAQGLYSGNVGLVLSTTLVFGLAAAGVYMISGVLGLVIPFANSLINLAIGGPLAGGFCWFMLRLLRGEPAALGDAFAGFSRQPWSLVACSLVQGLINLLVFIPVGLVFGFSLFLGRNAGRGLNNASGAAIAVGVGLALLAAVVVIYLSVLWTFSIYLVVDKGYGFWDAMQLSRRMVQRRWWMTFWFTFVMNLLSGLGALLCLVGLLYTAPLGMAAKSHLYDENFRDLIPKD